MSAPRQFLRWGPVYLQPVGPDDYPRLREIDFSPNLANRWRYSGRTPSPTEYMNDLWTGVLEQFTARSAEDGRVLGYVAAYNPHPRNLTVWIGMAFADESHRTGTPMIGVGLLLGHLFHQWPFRIAYGETGEEEFATFGSAVTSGLVNVAAVMKDHQYRDGEPSDRIIYSVRREDWLSGLGRDLRATQTRRPIPFDESDPSMTG